MPEIVRHEQEGLLVPPADAAELAAALQRLLGDEPLRARLGASGAERARAYAPKAVVPHFEAAYERVLASEGYVARVPSPEEDRAGAVT
jgi:glycosyltransferase involved in cell wall biosynthesis